MPRRAKLKGAHDLRPLRPGVSKRTAGNGARDLIGASEVQAELIHCSIKRRIGLNVHLVKPSVVKVRVTVSLDGRTTSPWRRVRIFVYPSFQLSMLESHRTDHFLHLNIPRSRECLKDRSPSSLLPSPRCKSGLHLDVLDCRILGN